MARGSQGSPEATSTRKSRGSGDPAAERFLRVSTVAERLDLSPAAIYKLIAAGEFGPRLDVTTGRERTNTRIRESELLAFIARRTVPAIVRQRVA